MRLEVLNDGYAPGAKFLFALARLVSGRRMPDAARLVFYRPDYYGGIMKELTHEAMRGPSKWTVAERELMAAFVSRQNDCAFCVGAHTATSALAYRDTKKVESVLADPETADIGQPLRATLRVLRKLTREHSVDAGDMRALLDAGVTPGQIEDALAVCFAFNVTNRLADAFGFDVPDPAAFSAGAKFLLRRGYR